MIRDGAALALELHGEPRGPREHLLALYPGLKNVVPELDTIAATAPPLLAEVHHALWIARCGCGAHGLPRPGCLIWLELPLGWCARCKNRGVGGGWRPIATPEPAERAAIEAVLCCRPRPEDRNWQTGETIDDLARQNAEHGDPVPVDTVEETGDRRQETGGWRAAD